MGLLSGILGGGKEKPAVSVNQTRPLPEFEPFYLDLARNAQSEFQRARRSPGPDFSGAVAPFNQNQIAAQEGAIRTAQGPVQDFVRQLLATSQQNLVDPRNPTNPVVQDAIRAAIDPALRDFQEQILPAIQGEAVLAGNTGSSRQGVAEALATDRLGRNILNTSRGITNDVVGQQLDQMLKTIALGQQTAATGVFPNLVQSGVGEQQQQQEQRERGATLQGEIFQEERGANALNNYASILASLPGGVSTGTQQAAQGGGGGLGSAIGLGLQGFQLGGAMFPGLAAAGPVGAGIGILSAFL